MNTERTVGSVTTCRVVVSYSFIAIVSVYGDQQYFTVDCRMPVMCAV